MKIELQEERNAFFLHLQHGHRDITCKQLRRSRLFIALQFDVLNSIFYSLAVEQEGILHAHASIRSTEVKIGPFASDTSPKQIDREGLGKRRTGPRQGTPHYQLYPRPI